MPKIKKSSVVLQLPYPDPVLSPNSPRRHWRQKQPAKQAAKAEAFFLAKPHQGKFTKSDSLQITLTFYPPDNRRRDLDNLTASMKAAVDGVFLGLGVDDSQIYYSAQRWGAVVENGAVELELKGL